MSFILFQSSQHCCLLERGVCLLGKSDWSRGPRRVAVLPLSLFPLFREQTQWSEDQLLGGRNSGQGGPTGHEQTSSWQARMLLEGVDETFCRLDVKWNLACQPGEGFALFSFQGFKTILNPCLIFKNWSFHIKIWVSVFLKSSEQWETRGPRSYPVVVCWCWVVAIPLDG